MASSKEATTINLKNESKKKLLSKKGSPSSSNNGSKRCEHCHQIIIQKATPTVDDTNTNDSMTIRFAITFLNVKKPNGPMLVLIPDQVNCCHPFVSNPF